MENFFIGFVALTAIAIAIGTLVTYLSTRRRMEAEIGELRALLKAREKAEIVTPAPVAPSKATPEVALPPKTEEIAAEVLAVIAASVAAFLGKTARVRGVHLLEPVESNAWAQQGRVYIQASHNLERVH